MSIGGVTERLAFLLELDASKANAEVRKFGQTAERELGAVDNRFDRVGTRMQMVGAGMLAMAGIAGRALYSMGQGAAQLDQSIGGTEAVFGEASGVIDDFAADAQVAAGLTERAFREATTLIGGGLQRMGFEAEEAAESSSALVQRGADLAALYGGSTKEAVDAFAAALRGEADPAERFNLDLRASVINAKAVEMGLASSTSEVDSHARAQALMAVVMEQSANAQGQFGREAESAAGRQAIATAQIEQFRDKAGQTAALITGQVFSAVGGLAQKFNELDAGTQASIGKMAAYGTAAVGAVGGTSMLAGTLLKMRDRLTSVVGEGENATRKLNLFGKAAAGLAAVGVVAALYEMGEALTSLRLDVEGLSTATDAELLGMLEKLGPALESNNELSRDFADQLLSHSVPSAERFADSMDAAGYSSDFLREKIEEKREVDAQARVDQEAYAATVDDAATAMEGGADAADDLAGAQSAAADATDDHRRSLDEVVESMGDFIDEAFGTTDATANWNDSVHGLIESLRENGTTLDLATEKGRANYQAGREVADGLVELMQRRYEETGSVNEAIAVGDAHVAQLRRTLSQAGLTQGQIDSYIDSLHLVPRQIATNVDLDTRAAMDRIRELGNYLASVTRANVDGGYRQQQGTAHAAGGRPVVGAMNRGGERGFELYEDDAGRTFFIPGRGGEVIPNHRAAEMLGPSGGGGGVHIGQVVLQALDVDGALRKLTSELAWAGIGS